MTTTKLPSSDQLFGFLAGLGVCMLIVLLIAYISDWQKSFIVDSCNEVGHFTYHHDVYICSVKTIP
jgi:hypothetical protein